jgi:hypothetical protein
MPRTERAWGFLAIALFAVAYLLMARFGLEAFPRSGDEHSYLLQGEIFARGHLSVPAPAHALLFQVDHVVIDKVVRSMYPPGWPLLLALGWLVKAPWIVAPILAALTLVLLQSATAHVFGPKSGLVAVLLLGVAPIFAINAASFYAHVATLFMGAVYVYGLLRAAAAAPFARAADGRVAAAPFGRAAAAPGWAAVGGAGLGALFLVRPQDAPTYALASLAFYRLPRCLFACALAAALVAALSLPYQAAQFGSPWTSGYVAFVPMAKTLFGEKGAVLLNPHGPLEPITLWWRLWWFFDLAVWLAPGTLALALTYALWPKERDANHRFLILLTLFPSLFVFVLPDFGESYGPRYLFPLLLPVAMAAGAAYPRVEAWIAAHPTLSGLDPARACAWGLAAVVLCGVVRTGICLEHAHVEIDKRSQLYRQVAGLGLNRAVIVVTAERSTFWARNYADFDAPVVYVSGWGRSDEEVARLFPDRTAYSARRLGGDSEWSITPILTDHLDHPEPHSAMPPAWLRCGKTVAYITLGGAPGCSPQAPQPERA